MSKMRILAIFLLATLGFSATGAASTIGLSGNPYPAASGGSHGMDRSLPQTTNPPFVYDPHEDIYEWKIKDHPQDPCYYDEGSGQWLGDCNLYQTAPGYSITVPNRINP